MFEGVKGSFALYSSFISHFCHFRKMKNLCKQASQRHVFRHRHKSFNHSKKMRNGRMKERSMTKRKHMECNQGATVENAEGSGARKAPAPWQNTNKHCKNNRHENKTLLKQMSSKGRWGKAEAKAGERPGRCNKSPKAFKMDRKITRMTCKCNNYKVYPIVLPPSSRKPWI